MNWGKSPNLPLYKKLWRSLINIYRCDHRSGHLFFASDIYLYVILCHHLKSPVAGSLNCKTASCCVGLLDCILNFQWFVEQIRGNLQYKNIISEREHSDLRRVDAKVLVTLMNITLPRLCNVYLPVSPWVMAGMLQAKKCLRKCAKCFDSDHTAHTQSIIRAFAFNSNILLYSFYLRRVKVWLDCAAAHAEHNLRNLHMSEDRFSHDEMKTLIQGSTLLDF